MEFRKPFVSWNVKEVEYKLKLTTSDIVSLESKLGGNLINILNQGLPSLDIMATIIQGSMTKFHHGIDKNKVLNIIDDYFDDGGSQIGLLTDVIMPIFNVSGFFPQAVAEQMETKLQEAKHQITNV